MSTPNTIRQEAILALLQKAIAAFNANETYLIKNDLSERCICSKLGYYIGKELEQSEFFDYTVDVEYNRGFKGEGAMIKTLKGKRIYPDLIVHKRGIDPISGFDNLFCIEMKKAYQSKGLNDDMERLRSLVDPFFHFCYSAGYMLMINRDRRQQAYSISIYGQYYGT